MGQLKLSKVGQYRSLKRRLLRSGEECLVSVVGATLSSTVIILAMLQTWSVSCKVLLIDVHYRPNLIVTIAGLMDPTPRHPPPHRGKVNISH